VTRPDTHGARTDAGGGAAADERRGTRPEPGQAPVDLFDDGSERTTTDRSAGEAKTTVTGAGAQGHGASSGGTSAPAEVTDILPMPVVPAEPSGPRPGTPASATGREPSGAAEHGDGPARPDAQARPEAPARPDLSARSDPPGRSAHPGPSGSPAPANGAGTPVYAAPPIEQPGGQTPPAGVPRNGQGSATAWPGEVDAPSRPPWQRGQGAPPPPAEQRPAHGGAANGRPGTDQAAAQTTVNPSYPPPPPPPGSAGTGGSSGFTERPFISGQPRFEDPPTERQIDKTGGRGAVRPSARATDPVRGRQPRPPRRASLQLKRFDPWSVLKLSLVLSVALFLVWMVAVGLIYGALDAMGVWNKLNGTYSDFVGINDPTGAKSSLISAGRVFGIAAIVGAVNIVLITAFATVGAFVYNVAADLAGGIEVTLSERD
jgi:hypothetical protein